MPNDPNAARAQRADPRLTRRRPSDAELDRLTSPEAMQNADDAASKAWDASSGLPGLIDAEPDDDAPAP